jgi:hypothetical protein
VGVGKTILLRSYLTKVDAHTQKTVYIRNLSPAPQRRSSINCTRC